MSEKKEDKEKKEKKKKLDPVKFDEYKTFVGDTARFTDRRQNISNLYVSVNSLLLTAIAFIVKDAKLEQIWALFFTIPLAISGIYISLWWKQLLHKYKLLVRLRFRVLREMEEQEGLQGMEGMYHREDELYPRDKDGTVIDGKGLNISDLETKLPQIFIILYSCALAGIVIALSIYLTQQFI